MLSGRDILGAAREIADAGLSAWAADLVVEQACLRPLPDMLPRTLGQADAIGRAVSFVREDGVDLSMRFLDDMLAIPLGGEKG